MERRYLVAALAIIATFAGVSRGFRFLEDLPTVHRGSGHAMARADCNPSPAARAMAKIRIHPRPASPAEAQMLAELNVPMPDLSAEIAQQKALAQCARAQAKVDAEQTRRDAMRLQKEMSHLKLGMNPISIQVNVAPDIQERAAEAAAQAAQANMRVQIAANELEESSLRQASEQMERAAQNIPVHVVTRVRCNVRALQTQTVQAMQDAVRQVQYGFASK